MLKVTLTMVLLAALVGSLFIRVKLNGSKCIKGYLWGLGADMVVDYTKKVDIKSNYLTITGWQIGDVDQPIQYSVVKKRWGLFPIYFDSCDIKGSYLADDPFHHTFSDLPNGIGYQVEISNFGSMSHGCLIIET